MSKETGREHAARDVAGDGRFLHLAHGLVGVVLTEMAGQFLDRLDDETIGFRRGSVCSLIAGCCFIGRGFFAITFTFDNCDLCCGRLGFDHFFGNRFFGGRFGFRRGSFLGGIARDFLSGLISDLFDRSRLLHGIRYGFRYGFRYRRLHFSNDDVGLENPVAGTTDLLFPALDRLFAALHLDAGLVALERHVGKSLLMETRDVALVFVMVRRPQDRATETAHRNHTEITRGRRHFDVFGDVKILESRTIEQMRDRFFAAQPDRPVRRATIKALFILRLETHLIALASVQDHLRKIRHRESAQRLLDVFREPLDSGLGRFNRGNNTGCRHVFAGSVAEVAISATPTISAAATAISTTAAISTAIGTTTFGTRSAPVITTGTSALAAATTAASETTLTAASLTTTTAKASATLATAKAAAAATSVITTSAATAPVPFALFVLEALRESLVGG